MNARGEVTWKVDVLLLSTTAPLFACLIVYGCEQLGFVGSSRSPLNSRFLGPVQESGS